MSDYFSDLLTEHYVQLSSCNAAVSPHVCNLNPPLCRFESERCTLNFSRKTSFILFPFSQELSGIFLYDLSIFTALKVWEMEPRITPVGFLAGLSLKKRSKGQKEKHAGVLVSRITWQTWCLTFRKNEACRSGAAWSGAGNPWWCTVGHQWHFPLLRRFSRLLLPNVTVWRWQHMWCMSSTNLPLPYLIPLLGVKAMFSPYCFKQPPPNIHWPLGFHGNRQRSSCEARVTYLICWRLI